MWSLLHGTRLLDVLQDDDTNNIEIHFSNFPQMAAHKHMEFMIKIVEDFGLIEDIEK